MVFRRALGSSLASVCVAAAALMVAPLVAAQAFPSKSINVVVPYPAGGPSDYVARLVQPDFQKSLGQQLIIENVGGVAGGLGSQKALSAPADGHTQLFGTPMELMLAPMALQTIKYKPEDFRLAGVLTDTSTIFLVRADAPVKTMDEFIAWAKTKPLNIANIGRGGLYHLLAEKLSSQIGAKFSHIPYKGIAPMMTDLIGGQIDGGFFPLAGPIPGAVREGKMKAIGVTSAKPHAMFPNVPTMSSHRLTPDFVFTIWLGVQVPKSTPEPVVARINQAVRDALSNEAVRKGLETTGSMVPALMTPAEADKFYASEITAYRAIARSINLQPE